LNNLHYFKDDWCALVCGSVARVQLSLPSRPGVALTDHDDHRSLVELRCWLRMYSRAADIAYRTARPILMNRGGASEPGLDQPGKRRAQQLGDLGRM
jgi:hypothetical protein